MSTAKRTYGGGSGEGRFYVIEARCTFSLPTIVTEHFVLDKEWRRIPLAESTCGHVPVRVWNEIAEKNHLLNYRAATAMAHLFLADLDANYIAGFGCVEVRLVRVKMVWEWSTEEDGVGEIINRTDGPREHFSPREEHQIALSARTERSGQTAVGQGPERTSDAGTEAEKRSGPAKG